MEAEQMQSYGSMMSGNSQASTALQMRLETQQLLESIELFLRGKREVIEQDPNTGNLVKKSFKIGQAKANDIGIQSILQSVSAVVNPQVVQGNFKEDKWIDFVVQFHIDFATNIVNNCYNWGIADDDLDVIIDFVIPLIEPYTSRLVDNKERESYIPTMKHVEQFTPQTPEGAKTGIFSR